MEEGPGKQKRKQMEEGIRWKRELERHRKGEREEERVSERETHTQREKLSAVYRQGILRRHHIRGYGKKKKWEWKRAMKKEQKKSTRCLYCIDVKLAAVKKRRKRKRKEGLASLMREQGISCVSMIVIAYPRPETDISQKSVNRCLSRATVSPEARPRACSQNHTNMPLIRSKWLEWLQMQACPDMCTRMHAHTHWLMMLHKCFPKLIHF